MLAEGGQLSKAARVVEKAWRTHPHPDLAQVFAHLRFGDAARDRLKRIESLVRKVPGHVEGALALAGAAIDAREFAKARAALSSFLAAPTKRVALLMAEIERAEHNNDGRAREWIARALNAAPDPTWTADGHVSDTWLPASPSGRLDAFEWRVPLSSIAAAAPVIEPDAVDRVGADQLQVRAPSQENATPAGSLAESAAITTSRDEPRSPQPRAEPVIPLIRAPDDPGPEAAADNEPQAEPETAGWRKMFE